ncbi:ATP-dependent endonuclease family protein [Nostocoides australiense Ben110]|uniref:ATP-dependent endonuclease family protein n=1 Tax=Nostocoides australiense Ben110 TaxID=1193182 RepID=W6K4A4_9MICO|nr:AAA family ATPase [Tetrasphaera australiensis]CCH74669.1 ATP-dependent endonuclease family protein [Tetrasphaera australiensis Ben110]
MLVRQLEIENFRGVASGQVLFTRNTLLVGGNNVGKSTICESLDLALGPERLNRRPSVDEHDFFASKYLREDGEPVLIKIRVVLTELSDEALRRFGGHLRRWNDDTCTFIDEGVDGADHADDDNVVWALPILFRARYDPEEDDFEADTFFDHPLEDPADLDEEVAASLGAGRDRFTRTHKRLCGFVFLRTLRTGSRALGLQRGSLLDTVLRLSNEGAAEMWMDTLKQMRELDPAVGDVSDLAEMRKQIRERLGAFVNLAPGADATAFFASDLTREHLREVVRLFIATGPSNHPVPFTRQGTGSINLLVFALLTMIAQLKGNKTVVFAMEEPEIALPPHTQRRVIRFVRNEMGQTIVTSHSPYVIEQFDPEDIVMLGRESDGSLMGVPIDPAGVKLKSYRSQRRQFSEAILSRAVLVVEGQTEASIMPIVSSVLEASGNGYTHLDLAGVSIFTANGDGDVPRWGPIFRALGKTPFALYDQQTTPFGAEAQADLMAYEEHWESPANSIEDLLVTQVPVAVLRRFLDNVVERGDFPAHQASYDATKPEAELPTIAGKVLKARKGDAWGYAAMLVEHCQDRSELPAFLVDAFDRINELVAPPMIPEEAARVEGHEEGAQGDAAADPQPS